MGGVPARQVFGWVLDSAELDGLAIRSRNINEAWSGLSVQGVREVVESLAPKEAQDLIDRLLPDADRSGSA